MSFDPVAPELRGPRPTAQTWNRITFVHWALEPERVAPLLPIGTKPDVLDGVTYVGLIPFQMHHAGFGRGHAVPYFGTFAETNVRLYSVDPQGRHGVVFRSLDSVVHSDGVRTVFGLPQRV